MGSFFFFGLYLYLMCLLRFLGYLDSFCIIMSGGGNFSPSESGLSIKFLSYILVNASSTYWFLCWSSRFVNSQPDGYAIFWDVSCLVLVMCAFLSHPASIFYLLETYFMLLTLWSAATLFSNFNRDNGLQVRFHPLHPQMLASGSLDQEVRLWDANTSQCLFSHHFCNFTSCLLTPELLLLTVSD